MSAYSHAPPPYTAAHGAAPSAAHAAVPDAKPSAGKSWTQLVRGSHDDLYAAWDSGALGDAAPPEVRGRSATLRTDRDHFHWTEWLQSITWHERDFGPEQCVVRFATHVLRSDGFEVQSAGASQTLASWKERSGTLQVGKRKFTAQPDQSLQSLALDLDGRKCVWECTRKMSAVEGNRWDLCTYGLYDAGTRELLASFRWITGAPKFACDMTLYIWDAGIDELVVLASFTAFLYQQWCSMLAEWNNLSTAAQFGVYEGLCEDESTRHTYGYLPRDKVAELREETEQLLARRRNDGANSGMMGILSVNAGVTGVM